jgi:hypothetical protein
MSVDVNSPLDEKLQEILNIKEAIREAAEIEEGVPFDGFAAVIEELKNATGGGVGNIEYNSGEFDLDNTKTSTDTGAGSFTFNYGLSKSPKILICFQKDFTTAKAHLTWHCGFIYTNKIATCYRGTSGTDPGYIGPTDISTYEDGVSNSSEYNKVEIDEENQTISVTKLYRGWRSGAYTWEAYTWADEDAAKSKAGKTAAAIATKTATRIDPDDIDYIGPTDLNNAFESTAKIGSIGYFQNFASLISFMSTKDQEIKVNAYCFKDCGALEEVSIYNLTGTQTFVNCTSLKKVTIYAANKDTFGAFGVFYNCKSLKTLDLSGYVGYVVPTLNNQTFTNVTSCKIIVPDKFYTDWIEASDWKALIARGFVIQNASGTLSTEQKETE